jgi:hypothetical protein
MGNLSRGITVGASEILTNTKLHNLVDLGAVSNIVNADISPSAEIVDTKLKDITTGGKVRGQSLLDLPDIPSGAGVIPEANLPTGVTQQTTFDHIVAVLADINGGSIDDTPIGITTPSTGRFTSLELSSGVAVTGIVDEDDMSSDSATLLATQQSTKAYVDANVNYKVFTADGTFSVPQGVRVVFITQIGGGGGGAAALGGNGSGGGGAGTYCASHPYGVTPLSSINIVIGAGGSGGAGTGGASGSAGGTTTFDTAGTGLSCGGGNGGQQGSGGSRGSIPAGQNRDGSGGVAGTGKGVIPEFFSLMGSGGSPASGLGGGGGGSQFGGGGTGGTNATAFGAGGGGGNGGQPGGNGADGICIVSW